MGKNNSRLPWQPYAVIQGKNKPPSISSLKLLGYQSIGSKEMKYETKRLGLVKKTNKSLVMLGQETEQ